MALKEAATANQGTWGDKNKGMVDREPERMGRSCVYGSYPCSDG